MRHLLFLGECRILLLAILAAQWKFSGGKVVCHRTPPSETAYCAQTTRKRAPVSAAWGEMWR